MIRLIILKIDISIRFRSITIHFHFIKCLYIKDLPFFIESFPKPVTFNEMLTNSVNKLTLNPFVKTLVYTNEFNSKSCTNLKQINKDLKL